MVRGEEDIFIMTMPSVVLTDSRIVMCTNIEGSEK